MTSWAFVAAVLGAQSTGLETRLDSFIAKGETLHTVAQRLSKASGETIIVTGDLMREPVLIDVQGKSVREVMDAMALASYGDWLEKNGAYTLIQSARAQEASREARHKRNVAFVEEVGKKVQELRGKGWTSTSAAEAADGVEKMRQRFSGNVRTQEGERPTITVQGPTVPGAGNVVLAQAIEMLGAIKLAEQAEGTRVVYSTAPNRMQRAFPGNLTTSLSVYRKAHQEIYDEVRNRPRQDFGANWQGSLAFPSQRDIQVAKANVIVEKSASGVSVSLQLVGLKGESIGVFRASIINRGSAQPDAELGKSPDEPIEVSQAAAEMVSLLNVGSESNTMGLMMSLGDRNVRVQAGGSFAATQGTEVLKPYLRNPGSTDFLGLALPEILKARHAGGYVAIIPDEVWTSVMLGVSNGRTSLQSVNRQFQDHVEENSGSSISVARPVDPVETQLKRHNRVAMQKLTDTVYAMGYGRLQTVAKYLLERPTMAQDRQPDLALFAVSMPFVHKMLEDSLFISPNVARLIALAPDVMTALRPGQSSWTISQMSPAMRKELESAVFSQVGGLFSGNSISMSVSRGEDETPAPMARDEEPTEAYPNGLPGDYAVSVMIYEDDGVLARVKGQPTGHIMTALDAGAILGFSEGLGGDNGDFKIPSFETYTLAKTRSLQVIVPGVRFGSDFTDGITVGGARPVAWNDLPEAFRIQAQRSRERMRESAKQMGQRQGGPIPPR
jgi:hypothetical protein